MESKKYTFINEKYWMASPDWLNRSFSMLKSFSDVEKKSLLEFYSGDDMGDDEEMANGLPFTVLPNGIAIIRITGTMQKHLDFFSFIFGGTSTVDVRSQLDIALNTDAVKGVLLIIASGGGSVSGTNELANDVRDFSAVKPINAFIEDLGASAAFWTASQAGFISANETAEVGSIGTVAVIHDFSQMFEKEGIKVHVISTGEHKGAFVEGSEVTVDQLAELQRNVDALNEVFQVAVSEGREMPRSELAKVSDGRVFIAKEAVELGLIDAVETLEDAVMRLSTAVNNRSHSNSERARALIKLRKQ